MLHDVLLNYNDFVEVLATLEFEVASYGTPEAFLHVGLRFDHVVWLGTRSMLL